MKFNLREYMFRAWYWYVNKKDKNAEVLFMNYGYSDDNQIVNLNEKDENNRYSIQLYHHLANEVNIKDKDILEIGCGRGGGLFYVTETFSPKTAFGIDLDKIAVDFSNKHYTNKELSFQQGDAQNLDLEDNSRDIILNVESSHRYPDMKSFLSEVSRILKQDGYFLYTDFRYNHEMDELKEQLNSSGLKIIKEKMITPNVVRALELDDKRKRKLVDKLVPGLIKSIALNFAGTIGSETYSQFVERKYIYYSYILQK
ncbi:MAG: class I SAM-dependent methyltransferase [Bacteroidales bacterium]|nr:class I SAM-dependent methyltransferase [Bacteroidales bacterium]MBN2756748.1 class I SAM-dependent methyltransferase [Bacteroidales bacterium]